MLDKFRGMDLISRLPCVVAFRVALPFDEILKFSRASELLVCDYLFDFIFIFSVDKVRWWSGEVWTMCYKLFSSNHTHPAPDRPSLYGLCWGKF